jgi:hypothetical protein
MDCLDLNVWLLSVWRSGVVEQMTHGGTLAKPCDRRACATLISDTSSGRLQGGQWWGSDGWCRTFVSATVQSLHRL